MWPSPSRELVQRFEDDPAVVYLLDRDYRLLWCNAAWDRFAVANGGEKWVRARCMGRSAIDVVAPELKDFYLNAFGLVRRYEREVGHVYECSSPEIERRFHMRILPAGENEILVVHSLVNERVAAVGASGDYRGSDGLVRMCAHCRRCLRPDSEGWDWVPALVAEMPAGTVMELCGFCREYHYPLRGLAADRSAGSSSA